MPLNSVMTKCSLIACLSAFAVAPIFVATKSFAQATSLKSLLRPKSATNELAKENPADIPKRPVKILSAMSTPLENGHPVQLLMAGQNRLQFPTEQRYSKWSVIFETPIRVESIDLETCDGTNGFEDGVELFVNFDEKRFFTDGGRKKVSFKPRMAIRALTIGFLESKGICLGKLQMKTVEDWMIPQTMEVSGDPVLADGAFGLSRPGQMESRTRKRGQWTISWEKELFVEGVRVWNGNQNPGDAFTESERIKDLELRVKGPNGTKLIEAALDDRRGFQEVEFKEAIATRSIEIKSKSVYPAVYLNSSDSEFLGPSEPIVAEIQFAAGGENWIPLFTDAAAIAKSELTDAVRNVRQRGFGEIIDRELRLDEKGEMWRFRFRSDGTLVARVFTERARTARAWSFAGSWRLDPSAKTKNLKSTSDGVSILVTGFRVSSPDFVDSLPCGNRCFSSNDSRGPSSPREYSVNERIEIQRGNRHQFILRNRTEPERRTLDFADLKMRLHSLYD